MNKYVERAAAVELANMSKATAFVGAIRIGTGRGEQQDIETYHVKLLVNGGNTEILFIEQELREYRQRRGPKPFVTGSTWEAICGISVIYDCAGLTNNSAWFNFVADFVGSEVRNVTPYFYGP